LFILLYKIYLNYHDYIYNPERIQTPQIISGLIDEEVPSLNSSSYMANIVKQDIINRHLADNVTRDNEFITKGVQLATPLIVGVLGLVLIYAV